jgi:hypothetical protein
MEPVIDEQDEFLKKYPWMQTLPKSVQDFFMCACSTDKDGNQRYEYADNFRMAALTDPKALADFQARHDKQCCGSREELIEDENGKLWIVGFNYGH